MSLRLRQIRYILLLSLLSTLVLGAFLCPTPQHAGINQARKALFLDLVDGSAHRPYVSRALLPTLVRTTTATTPIEFQQACADQVEQRPWLRTLFAILYWQPLAGFPYLVASVLMLLCFAGFGHFVTKLTIRVCGLPFTDRTRLALLTVAMLGLPPCFAYVSYVYDPPQLFLFTLALWLLATDRRAAFVAAFAVCCLNKETAVLLIPLFVLVARNQPARMQRIDWFTLAILAAIFAGSWLVLTWSFRSNPGEPVEFHLTRNLWKLAYGWSFAALGVFLSLAWLIFRRWSEQPLFLRQALVCTLLPLIPLTLLLGYLDEWRDYYEAYPAIFGLAVAGWMRVGTPLRGVCGRS